jgi:hypothetical protein
MNRRAQIRVRLNSRKVGHAEVIDWIEGLRDEQGDKHLLSEAVIAALVAYLRGIRQPVRDRAPTHGPARAATTQSEPPRDEAPEAAMTDEPASVGTPPAPSLADAAARMFNDA